MVDFHRLREVVEAASFLDGDERNAYLDQACGDDAELRREALELLRASAREDGLAPPAPGLAAAIAGESEPTSPELPERIGPYAVVGVIGSGGMGTVFEAIQDEPRRRVAVKVLKQGLGSAQAVARFRQEASVLARLRHPGIAQVYATGTHAAGGPLATETPWFAMEYVEDARTLLEYARARDLSRNARLRLFLRVAEALQHGHQKGVVHRDLKPDNILVDGEGNPKVIDFGVALARDPIEEDTTRFTLEGQLLGTLPYMSPEQFGEGDVDTRTDVYSLGVCLYELLTGFLPLELGGEALPEIARRVQNETPRRTKELTGDLRTVVFKALEKDRERRYETVAAFAGDVRRFLDSEPIEARAPSATYTLLLFARRNRALVAAAAFALVALLAAVAISTKFALDAKRSSAETRTLFGTLLERSSEMTSGISDELVALPGGVDVGRRLIRTTLEDLEDLDERAEGDPLVRRRLTEAWYRLGLFEARAEGKTGASAERALEALQKAEDSAKELLIALPGDRDLRILLTRCALERSTIQSSVGDAGGVRASIAAARSILEELVAERPNDVEIVIQLAYSYDAESVLHGRAGDYDALRTALSSAQEYFARAAELEPDSLLHDLRLAGTLVTLGASFLKEGRFDEAASEYARAAELLEPVVREDDTSLPHRELYGRALLWSGEALLGGEDFEAARRELASSLEVYRALHADDPVDPQHEITLVHLMNSLGVVERDDPEGDLERSAQWFLEALEGYDRLEDEGRLAPAYVSLRPRIEAGLELVEARLADG